MQQRNWFNVIKIGSFPLGDIYCIDKQDKDAIMAELVDRKTFDGRKNYVSEIKACPNDSNRLHVTILCEIEMDNDLIDYMKCFEEEDKDVD
ncbi:MAG: hypothetical protein WCY30_02290 [Candidatus Neomarinimicrobiota bacterium]|jgi:hypothetical protein